MAARQRHRLTVADIDINDRALLLRPFGFGELFGGSQHPDGEARLVALGLEFVEVGKSQDPGPHFGQELVEVLPPALESRGDARPTEAGSMLAAGAVGEGNMSQEGVEAVEQLVHRHAEAISNDDEAVWLGTWAIDATWTLGSGRELRGHDEIATHLRQVRAAFRSVSQTCLHGECEVLAERGTGRGRWYIEQRWQDLDGKRGVLVAHYDDQYIADTDGVWRFARRHLVPLYNTSS